MTAFNRALYAFWSSFLHDGAFIPAYLSGHVPEDAAFPYITFEVKQGSYASTGILTAFVWAQQAADADADAPQQVIGDVLAKVAEAIPEGGKMLSFPGGAVWLNRNDADFLSAYNPTEEDDVNTPTERPVYGGRVSYMAQFFIK